ncbi:MAG: glycosyltransferase family 87 protein [Desulfobaccales bacterium]|nr:glycosyltransferase family 87 protein [Desulfobaccales bacterium]
MKAVVHWPWVVHKFLLICLLLFFAGYLILWGHFLLTGSGLTDRWGNPVGGDFSTFWVASSLARAGDPGAAYDFPRLKAAAQAAFGTPGPLYWTYPPTFLLMVLPLSLLPYPVSLAVWLLAGLGAFLVIVYRLAPHPLTICLTLTFPATLLNLITGQNGFLAAALLGGGLLLLDGAPFMGGLLLGLLSFKPHLAVLIPVALVAGRRWRALLAMVIAAVGLAVASTLMLGQEVWGEFLRNLLFHGRALQAGVLPLIRMPTVFSALRLFGIGLSAALFLQGTVMAGATLLVAWTWRQEASTPVRSAVLVLGILLFTPYAFDYDLALLALPLAWLGWKGHTQGWRPLMAIFLILSWLTPLFFQELAATTGLQAVPLILIILLFLAPRGKPPTALG